VGATNGARPGGVCLLWPRVPRRCRPRAPPAGFRLFAYRYTAPTRRGAPELSGTVDRKVPQCYFSVVSPVWPATFHVPRCACVLILCACASVSVPALPSLDMSPSLRASSRDARPRPRRDLACSAACRPNRYRSCSWDGGRPWLRRRRPRRGRRRASRREQPASI
jgi:hypothetical protein